jgi:hypothetical protein
MNLRHLPQLSVKILFPPRPGPSSRFLWGLGVGIAACTTAAAFVAGMFQRAHPKQVDRAKGIEDVSRVNSAQAPQAATPSPEAPAA